jgi:ABC-2 type transport system permease protein
MKELFKKEIKQLLNSPVGYVVPALFALFLGYMFLKDVFVIGSASLKSFFGIAPWLLFLFIPALSMRTISEEKRTNTMEVLLTLPISEREVVGAKIGALATVIAITWALTFSVPLVLGMISGLAFAEIAVGYVGVFVLSMAYLSFALFISSKVHNQIASFLISTFVLFLITTLSSDFLANILPKAAQDVLIFLSPTLHMDTFSKGVVDMRSVAYFVGLFLIFFELTVAELKKRT